MARSGMDVGVLSGTLDDEDELAGEVRAMEMAVTIGAVDTLAERAPDVVLVGGADGLNTAFRSRLDVPLLPVNGPTGIEPVSRSDVGAALQSIDRGDAAHVDRATLLAELPDRRGLRGLFEARAITSDPATISAFELATENRTIGTFRADGVVVTSPAGSVDYGAAAGGPIMDPGLASVAVLPISPFMIQRHAWVLADPELQIRVTRDESTVGVHVDDRAVGRLGDGDTVTITRANSLVTVRVPQSQSPFLRT